MFWYAQLTLDFYILVGAYGTPYDVKVKKMNDISSDKVTIVSITFTTLTPGLRESPRKVYISSKSMGNSVFMLVTGTTANRFKNQENVLASVAQSFRAIEAPKSTLRSAQKD